MPNGTKKLRDAPQNIEALSAIVKANIKDQEAEHQIWYQDEAEDWIVIIDDDDLQLAYECAQEHFGGNMKLYVKPKMAPKSEAKAKTVKAKAKVIEPSSSSSDTDVEEYESMKSMIQATIEK